MNVYGCLCSQATNKGFKDLLAQGKVDTTEFSIGSKISDVSAKYGKPDSESVNYNGGILNYYHGLIFVTTFNTKEIVSAFMYPDGSKLYGITIGMTMGEIETILGKPDESGIYDGREEGEGIEFCYSITYNSGDYYLAIQSKDSPKKKDLAFFKKEKSSYALIQHVK